jgi:hypothetical protein
VTLRFEQDFCYLQAMIEESDSEEETENAMVLLNFITDDAPPRFNDYLERIVPDYID